MPDSNRPFVPEMENILNAATPVLDHGFIRLVDYMGNDAAVVQAARVSYGEGTKSYREDEGLIRYLMRNQHTTPFEMLSIKLHCKLPIFVARQWVRHRTAKINEESARYSVLKEEFYVPDAAHLAKQSSTNRQGRGELLDGLHALGAIEHIEGVSRDAYENYQQLLGPDYSLARELARMELTLNYYTEWYWKIDLHNLLHFLNLRTDAHAQYEIRAYADVIDSIVKLWVPMCYQAYIDYVREAVTFSGPELAYLKAIIGNLSQDIQELPPRPERLSNREKVEFLSTIGMAQNDQHE